MNLQKKSSNIIKYIVSILIFLPFLGVVGIVGLAIYQEIFHRPPALTLESIATENIDWINKAQALRIREGNLFAKDFDTLALGTLAGNSNIDSESSEYYTYIITTTEDRVLVQAIPKKKYKYIKAVIGGIVTFKDSNDRQIYRKAICKVDKVGKVIDPELMNIKAEDPASQCPEGSSRV